MCKKKKKKIPADLRGLLMRSKDCVGETRV